jgi:hypothetical protein
MESIGEMTLQELEALIERVVEDKLRLRPMYKQTSEKPIAELLDEIWNNRWTPPPGAKSSLEFLREDRDR